MLFVAAASAASSPCAGSSLFFCEDFGAGRDGWVEGRGDAKQFASHKHPWPSSVAKADDAGVLLDRRLGAGVLGKALPKAVRMSEVPLSLSFELTGVNAFDEEEREVGMLLHPMTCYGADVKLLGWFGPQTPGTSPPPTPFLPSWSSRSLVRSLPPPWSVSSSCAGPS